MPSPSPCAATGGNSPNSSAAAAIVRLLRFGIYVALNEELKLSGWIVLRKAESVEMTMRKPIVWNSAVIRYAQSGI
jgi:hypothetical protein